MYYFLELVIRIKFLNDGFPAICQKVYEYVFIKICDSNKKRMAEVFFLKNVSIFLIAIANKIEVDTYKKLKKS